MHTTFVFMHVTDAKLPNLSGYSICMYIHVVVHRCHYLGHNVEVLIYLSTWLVLGLVLGHMLCKPRCRHMWIRLLHDQEAPLLV